MNHLEMVSVLIAITASLGTAWAMMRLKGALLRYSAALEKM